MKRFIFLATLALPVLASSAQAWGTRYGSHGIQLGFYRYPPPGGYAIPYVGAAPSSGYGYSYSPGYGMGYAPSPGYAPSGVGAVVRRIFFGSTPLSTTTLKKGNIISSHVIVPI